MANTHPIAVKLDTQLHDRVRGLAKSQNRTPHYLMREAIAQYVEREEKRASLRDDALAAWQAFQTTGQHLSQGEADRWLAQLEAGEHVGPPECHD
jgi:predicted transcriptional regulator